MRGLRTSAAVLASLVVVIVAVAGCARLGARASASPATTAPAPPRDMSSIAGEWRGTITGSQLADPEGMKAASLDLVVKDDGTWTGVEKFKNSERVSAGTVRVQGDLIVLEGRITDGDRSLIGKPIGYEFRRHRDRDAYGVAYSYFVGSRSFVPLAVRKIS